MKFDKETIIGIVLCVVVVFAWQPVCRYMNWFQEPIPEEMQAQNAESPAAPAAATQQVAASPVLPVKSAGELTPAQIKGEKAELANEFLTVKLDSASGAIDALTVPGMKLQSGSALSLDFAGLGIPAGECEIAGWQVAGVGRLKRSKNALSFVRLLRNAEGKEVRCEQRWELDGSVIRCRYVVINVGKEPLQMPESVIRGLYLGPWQNVSGEKTRTPSHRIDYESTSGEFEDVKGDVKDGKFSPGARHNVKWAAVSNKYFCSIVKSAEPFVMVRSRVYSNVSGESAPYVSCDLLTSGAVLPAGAGYIREFSWYCGAKQLAAVKNFEPEAVKIMHFSWGPLDYLARLLLNILNFFHRFVGNFGWSIILLTLLVRIIFYPITARGNASMKKMQLVQPQLKELREKYKDNPQLMNSKMMELYKKEGVNPFGGCLPILLQIPVFFALYATLDGAVELRQASFLWCRDLSAADTVATLPLGFTDLAVNPLVLAMTVLMVIQQRMTPMSMDPMQKKMMLMMPIVMLFFFYDLPSGLTLYWTVSNFFSILQLRLQQRKTASGEATVIAPAKK